MNNEELRHRYAVNNAGSSTRKICGEKRSWQGKQRLESIEWKIKHANDSTSVFRGLFRADVIQLCQSAIVWTYIEKERASGLPVVSLGIRLTYVSHALNFLSKTEKTYHF